MSILNTAGFFTVYYILTFIFIEAACVVAWGHWYRSLSLKARRFAIAFGILGFLRILIVLLVLRFFPNQKYLDQVLAIISMGILAWSFSPYLNNRATTATFFIVSNTLLALGTFSFSSIVTFNSLPVLLLFHPGKLLWLSSTKRWSSKG